MITSMGLNSDEPFVVAFVVRATVAGKKQVQSISQRFTSRSAAEHYCQLARSGGFGDAYVHELMSHETSGLNAPRKRSRR